MAIIGTGFSMSLDGFIAKPDGDVSRLFRWYASGDTVYTMPDEVMEVNVSADSSRSLQELHQATGAIVSGRKLFNLTNGWNGRHPMNVPVFVVTHSIPQDWMDAHPGAPFTFVTDGVESAVEQARVAAGDKHVGIGGAQVAQQALKAGLVDEIGVDLVPVLLGDGIRLFDQIGSDSIELKLIRIVEAPDVIHLSFRVVKEM